MSVLRGKQAATSDATVLVHGAGVGVVIAATLGIYLGVAAPALRAKSEQAARTQQAAADAQDLRVLEDNTQALERLSRTLESRLLETVELRSVDQLNRQVASVSELVEQENLHLTKVDPGEPVVTPRYTLVPIRVAGQGAFSDVVAFLNHLHGNHKDTEVRAFAVHVDERAPADVVAFELSLGWYAVQVSPGARAARSGVAGGALSDVQENR